MRTDQMPAEPPEAGPDHDDRRQTKRTGPSSSVRGGLTALLLAVLLLGGLVAASVLLSPPSTRPTPPVALPYQPAFLDQVRAGNVVSVHTQGASVEGELQRAVRWPADDEDARPSTRFTTEVPAFADLEGLGTLLAAHDVTVEAEPESDERPFFQALILAAVPFLLIGGVVLLFLRRSGAGRAGGLVGRSPARIVEPGSRLVTFADVAGVDEAKEQLTEIVDFLRDPAKYRALGGRMPHGVLLTGPPGTGKTLLARALAGEAGVPFFSMSASEFVEMYVGVGASRVRDLFAKAKAAAPAIVFIDELDAIGRTRGPASGLGGAHEEREQTLNQILTELDGFDPSSGVIVLSATNRAEIIDRALLRPGRFDRRVAVQPPDITGRRQILAVHTRSVPLAADADLDALARSTPGMVGADLANLVNEAALLAARRGHAAVGDDDLLDALEQVVLGTERRIVLSEADRRRTAYHEAAHALTGMLLPAADPVRKVSIIPHGEALGVTLASPEADRFNIDEDELRAKLQVLLAGRAGERLALGSVTTGAENDITMATELARHMAGRWGMSEAVGPVDLLSEPGAVAPWHHELAPETERVLDSEVRRLVEEAQEDALALLAAHRPQLDALAAALLERETLDAAQAAAAAGLPVRAAAALTRS